ncbi:hypothetical protein [Brachybacterium sp. J153]|uniref:hypothetical protein n=1 Tax=Brachybacterium sp. J153 TaxID=3116488 RepID=UPI002E773377|nr:hypothetical protein [Brachybacterium sp. J153]MEE1617235.1 hypothetical protein [Brachybacterium sp. J153]
MTASQGPRQGPHGGEERRASLLADLLAWRRRELPIGAEEEARLIGTLLRLKDEQLDSPDPEEWTEDLTTELLTRAVPRHVVQTREDSMELVPALGQLFAFLQETGRWRENGPTPGAASLLLESLEFATLEAADDPTRRSFSTNVLGYGLERGVDLEDPEELAAYMRWYTTRSDEDRVALAEFGNLARISDAYDRETALEVLRAEPPSRAEQASWPWFIPEIGEGRSGDDPLLEEDPDPELYRRNGLLRAAEAILEVVGEGCRVTDSGALGRAETARVGELLGLPAGARSMWHRPEIAGAWVALLDGGWLALGARRVTALAGPVPFLPFSEDPSAFAEWGHAVLTALLLGRHARAGGDGGFRGLPETLAALVSACVDGGVDLPVAQVIHEADRNSLEDLVLVRRDLDDLVRCGLLEGHGSHVEGSAAVLTAVLTLLAERRGQT